MRCHLFLLSIPWGTRTLSQTRNCTHAPRHICTHTCAHSHTNTHPAVALMRGVGKQVQVKEHAPVGIGTSGALNEEAVEEGSGEKLEERPSGAETPAGQSRDSGSPIPVQDPVEGPASGAGLRGRTESDAPSEPAEEAARCARWQTKGPFPLSWRANCKSHLRHTRSPSISRHG